MATRKNKDEVTDANRPADGASAPRSPRASGATKKAATSKTEDVMNSAKSAAKKAVKSVAKAVGEAVDEVKKAAKANRESRAKSAAKSTAPDPVSAPDALKTRAKSNRTAVAAMAPGTTSEDVRQMHEDAVSSAFLSESEIADQSPTSVKEHYFEDQNDRVYPPVPETPELPDHYDDTRITVLVRDPEWVYAYWEVNDQTRAELNFHPNGHHNQRMVVRLYKISDRNWPEESAHYFFDVDVSPYSSSWYIHLPETDQTWCAELGFFDEKQNYFAVCRSNTLTSPRNTISEETDSEWMTVEESFQKIYNLAGGGLVARLHGTNGSSNGASESILRQIQRQVTGTLDGLEHTMSSQMFSGSMIAESPAKKKDFFLEVRTELILYGVTVPGSKVTVQGNQVTLNADGTFSLRFALPDGEQILNVHAVNSDGDMERSITPVVERTTRD